MWNGLRGIAQSSSPSFQASVEELAHGFKTSPALKSFPIKSVMGCYAAFLRQATGGPSPYSRIL
jgi:hypothetical protein